MNQELAAAWDQIDARLRRLQERHRVDPAVPLYESGVNPGASDAELTELQSVLAIDLPPVLLESLSRWNGRWIAHDHVIDLAPIQSHMYLARIAEDFGRRASARDKRAHERMTFERVIGPINLRMNSRRRILFGSHEYSGSSLYLDFEDPPRGGSSGQIIRIGEEPIAEIVAPSFIAFLKMVAAAPLYDDDPDHDPLAGGSAT